LSEFYLSEDPITSLALFSRSGLLRRNLRDDSPFPGFDGLVNDTGRLQFSFIPMPATNAVKLFEACFLVIISYGGYIFGKKIEMARHP
jgi:hypothetical protein